MADPTPQKQTVASPAQAEAPKPERRRIPMSTPMQKLQVPELVGFYLHWFRNDNVHRALQAGYEFVDCKEINMNPINIGAAREVSGSSDLGTRVTLVNGTDEHGNAIIAVLMKLPVELRTKDEAEMNARNAQQIEGIFRGEPIGTHGDQSHRYVHTAVMNRPVRKAAKVGPR